MSRIIRSLEVVILVGMVPLVYDYWADLEFMDVWGLYAVSIWMPVVAIWSLMRVVAAFKGKRASGDVE